MLSSEIPRKLWQGWSRGYSYGPFCDDDSRMLSSEADTGDRKLWSNASHGYGSQGCNYCSSSDNDSRMLSEDLGDTLSASKEHIAWKKLFYEKGRTHTGLAELKDCTIILSDCHIE